MSDGRVAYAVRPALIGVLVVATAALALRAWTSDGPGRVLFGVLAFGAAFEAARGALLRPTLAADASGLTLALGLRRYAYGWDEVRRVGSLEPPAGGARPRRRANALEIDLGDRLLVVPAYRLGAPVAEVTDALNAVAGGLRSRGS